MFRFGSDVRQVRIVKDQTAPIPHTGQYEHQHAELQVLGVEPPQRHTGQGPEVTEDFEEEFFNDEDEDEELNPIRQSERETAKYEIMRVKRNGLNEIRAVVNSPTYSQVLRKMKIKDISSSVRTEVLLEAISHKSKVVL